MRRSWRIALGYAAAAGLWILVSDLVLARAGGLGSRALGMEILKGLAFVAFTAWALHLLLDREAPGPESPQVEVSLKGPALTLAAVAVLAALGAYFSVQRGNRQLRAAQREELAAVADLKVGQLRTWLDERAMDAEDLAEELRQEPQAAGLLARARRIHRWAGAALVDPSGGAGSGDPAWPVLVAEALRTPGPRFGTVHLDGAGEPVLDLGIRVEGTGRVLVLQSRLRDGLFPMLQTWPLPSASGETVLVERRGAEVVVLNDLKHRPGGALRLRFPAADSGTPAARAVRGEPTPQEGRDYRDVPALAAWRKVPGTPWSLVVKVDLAEVDRPLTKRAEAEALLGLGLVAGAGLVLLGLWQARVRLFHRWIHRERNRREQWEKLFYELPFIGMAIGRSDGRIVRCNEAFARMLGYGREELKGMAWADLTHPDDLAAGLPLQHEAEAEAPDGFVREGRFVRKDGSVVDVVVNGRRLRDAEGDGAYDLVTVEDVTRRKRVAEALKASEASHRAMFESNPNPMYVVARDNRHFLAVNDAALACLRTTREALLGRDLASLAPEGLPAAVLEGGTALVAHRRGDGAPVVMEASGRAVDYLGIPAWVVLAADVTERVRAEARLRDQDAQLAEAQAVAHLGSWEHRLDQRVLDCSPETRRILELEGEGPTVLLKVCVGRIHPDDRRRVFCGYRDAVARDGGFEAEARLLMPDGRVKVVRQWARLLPGDDGQPPRMRGALQDVSEAKRAEAQLRMLAWAMGALSRSNAAVMHAESDQAMLEACCGAITAEPVYRLAWVGWAGEHPEAAVTVAAAAGPARAYLDDIRISSGEGPFAQGPTGSAIRTGRVQVENDVLRSPACEAWWDRARACGIRSQIAVPLRLGGRVVGVLAVHADTPGAFGEAQVRLFGELGEDLAFGLETRRTRSAFEAGVVERQRQAEQIRRTLEEALAALAATLEKRDPYTAGHERRVAGLTAALAEEMGLDAERVHWMRLAALVHDIGKIQVPSEILTKPSRLSPVEMALMKVHPEAGYEILKGIGWPWPIADVVRQHHEYLDGSGYPLGLQREEIRLESRILTVADIVESMSSHRPYRPALGMDTALEEIERLAAQGKLDPQVVEACCRLFRDRGYVIPR